MGLVSRECAYRNTCFGSADGEGGYSWGKKKPIYSIDYFKKKPTNDKVKLEKNLLGCEFKMRKKSVKES